MKITIPVNHNFYAEKPIPESRLAEAFSSKKTGKIKEIFSSTYELKLGAGQLKHVKVYHFKRNGFFEVDKERLILKLYRTEPPGKEKEYIIQTGLYAGILYHRGCSINITTKYGDAFLKRMLNFVNDIYVDNEQINGQKSESENQFWFIIAYLFIQSLEKAAVLGLPQHYKKHQERGHKVRGSLDFNQYLKRDIPFQGKITTTFRERMYVQEVVDVLYLTLRKLEKMFSKEIHSRLPGLFQLLKQHYSGRFVSYSAIQIAKGHQAINNPMYSGFKKVLEYAEIILLEKDLMPEDQKKQLTTSGFLFDIAELYELYLEKLFSRNFPDWTVSGQVEWPVYQQSFFARHMFPDIVLTHKITNKVVVLDGKFKNMEMRNSDIDRNDLHQIHSYSGYFRNRIVASGLIYPLSKENISNEAYSEPLYGDKENEIRFIVDGIFVHENQTMNDLIKSEESFVKRIASVICSNEMLLSS